MKYTVKNFKIFNEQGVTFDIAPITMLTGCNSSGKSSLVKSMIVLGEYLAKVKSYLNTVSRENKLSALAQAIDFAAGVKDTGGFDNVLNENNTNGLITFQYTVDSKLLMEEVTVTLVFVRDETDMFHRNGILYEVTFQRADGTAFYKADPISLQHLFIDMSAIQDTFMKVALDSTLRILDEQIAETERDLDDPLVFTGFTEKEYSEIVSRLKEKKDKRQNILSLLPQGYERMKMDQLSPNHLNLFTDMVTKKECDAEEIVALQKYQTVFYLPWLKILDGVQKDQTRQVIESELQNVDLTENERFDLNYILDDFEKSEFDNFNDYYKYYEKLGLKKCYKRPNEPEDNSLLDRFCSLTAISEKLKDWTNIDGAEYTLAHVYLPHYNREEWEPKSKSPDVKTNLSLLYKVLAGVYCKKDSGFEERKAERTDLDYICKNEIHRTMQRYFESIWEELLVDATPAYLSNLQYVGSTRATAQRLYSFDNNDSDLNPIITEYLSSKRIFGDVFAGYKKNAMLNAKFDMKKSKEELVQYEEELDRLFDRDNSFMAIWLNKLGLCDSFSVDPVTVNGVSLGYSITFTKNGKTHSIADEGYGCIQLFSVLMVVQNAINLHDIGVIKDSLDVIYTIAVEEPENHLHPKLQSLLADMFLEANEIADVQFLVETHSEYLIRKSQVLVKKWYEENKETDKSCPFQAYYIPSGGTPYSLGYRKDGKFSESFGPGFYDESANLTFEIM